ncbi:MAG: hypothetical protein K2Y26_14410 [Gemmatimonadaceae bacterium]|nr:hypothetical protein [Gemmatimonadaceae bacterium]
MSVSLTSSRLLPLLTFLGAFLMLSAGYTLLWHGGTSLAAALITLGYVVGIPLALILLARDGTPAHPDGEAPP